MQEINRDKQLELLRWLLTTLDGQWLSKTAAVYSPGEASKLNGRVRSSLGRTEMKAILSLLGKSRADNLSDAAQIVQTYLGIAYGERGFSGTFRPVTSGGGQQLLEIEIARFSALDAIKKVAQAAGERPGLAAEGFWSTWFETLLPDEQVEITVRSAESGADLIRVAVSSDSFIAPLQEELSPIAAVLQIPLEDLKPATPAPPSANNQPATNWNPPAPATPEKPANYPFTSGHTYRPDSAPMPIGYSEQVEAPLPPSALPATPQPIIGGQEPGANRQNSGSLNQRLSQLRQNNQEGDMLPPGMPPALQAQEPPPPVPPQALRIDASGRPLFSEDVDESIRRSVDKRKAQQKMPLMSRLLISKEAKELLQQSDYDSRPVGSFSLASGIESVLQRLIAEEQTRQPGSIAVPVHVVDGPEGDLEIHVGPRVYGSVGEVPPGRVLELLQQAVAEWTGNQDS